MFKGEDIHVCYALLQQSFWAITEPLFFGIRGEWFHIFTYLRYRSTSEIRFTFKSANIQIEYGPFNLPFVGGKVTTSIM